MTIDPSQVPKRVFFDTSAYSSVIGATRDVHSPIVDELLGIIRGRGDPVLVSAITLAELRRVYSVDQIAEGADLEPLPFDEFTAEKVVELDLPAIADSVRAELGGKKQTYKVDTLIIATAAEASADWLFSVDHSMFTVATRAGLTAHTASTLPRLTQPPLPNMKP